MNLSEFCIRRPVFTILLMAALTVGGFSGYRTLAVSALPRVDFPTISVSASLPGASPETMASSVATPLERQFSTIAGVSSMTSTSFLGNTDINLTFNLDRDIDGAALDVQTAISATLRRLPREMTTPPSFRKVNPSDQPIFFVAVSSDTIPLSQVNEYADTMMAQRISTLPGVAQVVIFGAQKYAVRVQVDPSKLAAKGISFDDVRSALGAGASNAPVGVISGQKQLFNLKVEGQPDNAAGFGELIVLWKDGAPVRVKDIATVSDDVEDNRSIAFINGKQAVVIAIQRQPDANTIDVVRRVRELLPVFRSSLPASIELTPMLDRSVSINDSVNDVQHTMFLTIALVIAVIYLFLRHGRATLIPALAVPISIVATYGAMALFDFSINNISLLALTLCVGFVVDDAIVMLENIVRHIEEGMAPFEAALLGAREIGFTIVSITFSLVAVFIPVLFMPGIVGRVFHEFAVTISVAILVSGLVSLTLTPMLCSRLLKAKGEERESAFSLRLEHYFQRMLSLYDRSLQWSLDRRRLMLFITLLTVAGSAAAFVYAPKGFFPTEDTGFVFAQTRAAQDISYEAMVAKQKQVAEVIAADPAIASTFYAVGGSRALNAGRVFFGLKPRGERPTIRTCLATIGSFCVPHPLHPFSRPISASEVIDRLQGPLRQVQGITVSMQVVQNINLGGRLSEGSYQYTLQGSDLDELYEWSDKLLLAVKDQPGIKDMKSDLQLKSLQALVNVDQQKAASVGLNYDNIRQALYGAFGTSQVATLYTPSNDYAVIMEVSSQFQQTPEDIGKIYVRGSGGQMVPLDSVATIKRAVGPLSVNHQGQMPAVTLSFNLEQGTSLSQAMDVIARAKQKIGMPESISGNFQGAAQVFQQSFQGMGLMLLLAVIVIYIILGMLYESFMHPITILSGLPSAGIGAILTLWIFGMEVSVIAFVGIILLIGIVKKNAIMMIDFAVARRAEGKSPHDAIYQACLLRFRPIMMTSMAAIFGTIPIAAGLGAGAELRQPLGIAVVGGLLTSQLLTLYITPVVYLYLEELRTRFSRKA